MRNKRRVLIAAVTVFGLTAAACGSDSKSSSTTVAPTTTAATAITAASTEASATTGAAADTTEAATASSTAGSETASSTEASTDTSTEASTDASTAASTEASTDASTASSAAADFKLTDPVKLVALISDPGGTDANAVADFNNGARLAVDEINAAGGIGGLPVGFDAIETPPTGDAVINSFNLALEEKPTALLGPISSTAVLAISPKIDAAGIPTIHGTTEPTATHDGAAGSKWLFGNRASNDGAAAIAVKYATEELGAKKLGLMYVNTAFGTTGAAAMKTAITAAGASVSADQSFEYNATDLTNAVLAMDGSDAILDWGTPGTVGTAVNTLAQQGVDIPHIGPGSIGFDFFKAIVGDDKLTEGLLGVLDCNPVGDTRPEATKFVAAYTAKYGSPPSYAAAEQYDTVYQLKYVIDQAGSDTPESIRAGLESLKGWSGACSPNYTSANGELNHGVVVAKYVDGALVTQKEYTIDG